MYPHPPLGFLRCGRFLPDIGNIVPHPSPLPVRSRRLDTPQNVHYDPYSSYVTLYVV